jgi:hypothetical protein
VPEHTNRQQAQQQHPQSILWQRFITPESLHRNPHGGKREPFAFYFSSRYLPATNPAILQLCVPHRVKHEMRPASAGILCRNRRATNPQLTARYLTLKGGTFTMKTILRTSIVASLLAIAMIALMPIASLKADTPGKHPHYLHALTDLRTARALIEQRPGGGELHQQEKDAVHKINDAIKEIKAASIDDGKDIADHPPIDSHLDWPGRLHKSKELVDRAIGDCSKEEDNPYTQGLQMRVLKHLHEANHHLDEAIAIVASH